MAVEIEVTPTRNEHSIIFKLDRRLIPPGTGLSFADAQSAESHPLARALFQVRGVVSVWILGDEIQVTKDEKARWGSVKSRIIEVIRSNVNSG
ncbi:MAG: NifU N-terminal domain-containing protein [Nitrospinae bacterium]|nr:NifU N-terminal domain-containing protein [Nitrospinota bacterium]